MEDAGPTSGPAERIAEEEVRAAVEKTKVGKAAGPTGLVSENHIQERLLYYSRASPLPL